MKKIGILGGVFNPPHNLHFSVAQEILNNNDDFEKIIFVPVGDKYKKAELISSHHRYNMLKLICDKNPKFEVSRFEIDEEIQPFAYQTLDKLSKIYPDKLLHFILGTDSLKTLHKWANLDYLLTKYIFLVYQRGNDNFDEILYNSPELKKYKNNIIFLNNDVFSNLSSSYIRNNVKNKKNINYLVPDEILTYIKENKLYVE